MPEVNVPGFEDVDLSPPQLDPGEYTMNIYDKVQLRTAESSGKQYLEVPLKVVEGPEQQAPDPNTGETDATGRTMNDRVYLSQAALWRLKALLVASGLLARDDKDSPMAQGNINTDMLTGTTVQVKLTPQMNNGREYRNVEYVIG